MARTPPGDLDEAIHGLVMLGWITAEDAERIPGIPALERLAHAAAVAVADRAPADWNLETA